MKEFISLELSLCAPPLSVETLRPALKGLGAPSLPGISQDGPARGPPGGPSSEALGA